MSRCAPCDERQGKQDHNSVAELSPGAVGARGPRSQSPRHRLMVGQGAEPAAERLEELAFEGSVPNFGQAALERASLVDDVAGEPRQPSAGYR